MLSLITVKTQISKNITCNPYPFLSQRTWGHAPKESYLADGDQFAEQPFGIQVKSKPNLTLCYPFLCYKCKLIIPPPFVFTNAILQVCQAKCMKCGAFGHMNIDKRCFLEFDEIMSDNSDQWEIIIDNLQVSSVWKGTRLRRATGKQGQ